MIKNLLLIASLISSFNAFTQDLNSENLFREGIVVNKNFEVFVPFESINGWICIKMTIQDTPLRMLFDTHAFVSTISDVHKEKLALKNKGSVSVKDAKSELKTTSVVSLNNIQIGNLKLDSFNAVCSKQVDFITCAGFDGILGANIINRFNWDIDFDSNIIKISDKQVTKDSTFQEFYFYFNNHLPCATLSFNGKKYENSIIDFGYGGTVIYPNEFQNEDVNNEIQQGNCYANIRLSNGFWGQGRPDTAFSIPISDFKLGNTSIPSVVTNISSNQKYINLGIGVFSNFHVVIDNRNSRLLLKARNQNAGTAEKKRKAYPLSIDWIDGKLVVSNINLCVEGLDKDVEIKSEIIKINGKSASDFEDACSFDEWFRRLDGFKIQLMKNKKTYKIKRGEEKLLKELRKKNACMDK